MNLRRKHWIMAMLLVLMLALTGQAFAFQDLNGVHGKEQIMQLKEQGIVNGVTPDSFQPDGSMTYAQGVALIVKALSLNIDHIRFIKEPLASDYFTNVPDDAWYAQAFIIAAHNGLNLPKDVDPNQAMTREQFGYHLMSGVDSTGSYAYIKIFIQIADSEQLDPMYLDHIQRLIIIKAAKLDEEGKFYPKNPVTRADAAVMVHAARAFIESHSPAEPAPSPEHGEVEYKTEAINKDVVKVTLSWGEKPNAGYRIAIDRVDFHGDTATIRYSLSYPDKDRMYAQVITAPVAETYVSSRYKIVVEPNGSVEKPRTLKAS